MSRWIDADAFIENLNKIFNENKDAMDFMSIAVAREFINSTEKDINNEEIAPSIDIVRCKECKFSEVWESTAGNELYCEKQRVCPYDWGMLTAFYVKADDYCSYGERKTDE